MRLFTSMMIAVICGSAAAAWADDPMPLWSDGQPQCWLILPAGDRPTARLARSTFTRYLGEFFNLELPESADPATAGNYIVVGSPADNPVLAQLVRRGLKLATDDFGDEGFQILTHRDGPSRYLIINGRTPRAIKHGCQELLFYHLRPTAVSLAVDWPLDLTMKPALAYRGVYILPCWSAQDSLESWQRVLRFSSELTLNRNWFWLDGFPVAGHTGEYAGTALADERNVQGLIDLCNHEDMKFLIGGGWFTWHHHKAVGDDLTKGRDYYLAYLRTFKNFHGFYFEPPGEGSEKQNWQPFADALCEWIKNVLRDRPDLEFAVAIGKFNNPDYLKQMSQLDPKRVYWWWCWGDPGRDKALDLYPSIVRWHTTVRMSNYHGSIDPPGPSDRQLAGVATSYDPGQGYGNPWDGWGKLGYDKPRNFDPYNVPFFAHQYFYRERCWNLDLSEADFVSRLHRRLFDADAPADAGRHYWNLSRLTLEYDAASKTRTRPAPDRLAAIRKFLDSMTNRPCTPRQADTLRRMEQAMSHLTPDG